MTHTRNPKINKGAKVEINNFVGTILSVQWDWKDGTYAIELEGGRYIKWISEDEIKVIE